RKRPSPSIRTPDPLAMAGARGRRARTCTSAGPIRSTTEATSSEREERRLTRALLDARAAAFKSHRAPTRPSRRPHEAEEPHVHVRPLGFDRDRLERRGQRIEPCVEFLQLAVDLRLKLCELPSERLDALASALRVARLLERSPHPLHGGGRTCEVGRAQGL